MAGFRNGLERPDAGQADGRPIRVLLSDGQAINALQAVLRVVPRAADLLPSGYLLGLLTASMNDRFQRLGDLACGTIVVIEERQWLAGVAQVQDPEVHRLAARDSGRFPAGPGLREPWRPCWPASDFPPERRIQLACIWPSPWASGSICRPIPIPTDCSARCINGMFITEEELEKQLAAVASSGGNGQPRSHPPVRQPRQLPLRQLQPRQPKSRAKAGEELAAGMVTHKT